MQKIRLTRIGKKKHPFYRIVVTPKESPVQGKFTAILGNYDPFTKNLSLNEDSILEWLNTGAQPSNTVAKLLLGAGMKHKLIVYKKARRVSKKELEAEKVAAEAEKVKLAAEKEAAKAEWDEKAQEIAEEHAEEKAAEEAAETEVAGEAEPVAEATAQEPAKEDKSTEQTTE
jgi:small subunit ribosomal protein S16